MAGRRHGAASPRVTAFTPGTGSVYYSAAVSETRQKLKVGVSGGSCLFLQNY